MSHYKPYPAYKDSGVEWLGKVPEHWKVSRLASVFEERRTKVSDKYYPALSVTKQGILPQLESVAKTDDGDNRRLVCKGDIAINSRSDRKGSSGLVDRDGSVSLIITVLKPSAQIQGEFAHHLIRSEVFQEEFYRVGNGLVADLWTTNYSSMREIKIALLPVEEQKVISDFLDRETTRIDTLIAKKTRFIELLKEKRQVLITQAVTKGLNPNVKMKDSGVEWLGEVPEHWEVVPLRWYTSCRSGGGISTADVISESDDLHRTPVIGGNGRMGFTQSTNVFRAVLAIGRVGALCGNVHQIFPPAWITDNSLVLELGNAFDLTYLEHVLRSRNFNEIAAKTAQPLITGTQVSDQRVPCPPTPEQIEISLLIEVEATRLATLVSKTERSINLLKERRSALITAAVTGQIDLREAPHEPPCQEPSMRR